MDRTTNHLLLLVAAATLGASAPPDEEQRLFRDLCSRSVPAAAVELAARGEPGVAYLVGGLRRGGRVAALCAWALWQHPHPDASEHLRPLLFSANQVAGYWAAKALGRTGDGASVSALAKLLPDERNAFWELSRGATAIVAVRHVRGKRSQLPAPAWMPNIRVAFAALEALGCIGGPRAQTCLMKALARPQYLVRYGAARGLGIMGCRDALQALARVAAEDSVLIVRRAAAEAMSAIQGVPSPRAAIPRLPRTILFIKAKARTESNLGFRDSYFFPKMPWYHWGENLYSLTPPQPDGTIRNLTQLTDGAVQGPELSHDGERVLFAMRKHFKKGGFHIFEMNVDGTGLRQLTIGNCNDVDPCYLPNGRIAFCSDRAGYREYYHQERSRVLYAMDRDGSDIRQITFNPNQDYEPYVLSDGRVLYSSYRFYAQDGSTGPLPNERFLQRIETVLRTVNPSGSNDQLLYGAMRGSFYTPLRPTVDSLQDSGWHPRGHHVGVSVSQHRELPNGHIVCVTPAGLTLVDPLRGPTDCEMPFFPEVLNLAGGEEVYIHNHDDMNPVGRYTTPYPLDDEWLIVSHAPWHDLRHNGYGLYLFHMPTRTLKLLYDDPALSDIDPIPVAPRARAPAIPCLPVQPDKRTGFVYCNSVFSSDVPFDRQRVRSVRVISSLYQGLSINANASFRTRALGTVPIERDGSFYVEVPADTPFRFQLLDENEGLVAHETAFNYVRPGERKGCIGCHEPKDASPPNHVPMAMRHPPYRALHKRGDPVCQGWDGNTYAGLVRD